MAKRYSGDVSMRLSYRDAHDDYKVTLSSGGRRKVVYVLPPAILQHTVDSPKAYDDTARAAIAFAEDEGFDMQPDYTDSGVRVTRSRRKR